MLRNLAKHLLPWLVAGLLVAYSIHKIPLADLWAGLQRAQLGYLVLVLFYLIIGVTITDIWATAKLFTWFLTPLSFRDLLPIRVASYVISIVNYYLGQAGIVYFIYRTRRVPLSSVTGLFLLIAGNTLLILSFMSMVGVLTTDDPWTRELGWVLALIGFGAAFYFGLLWCKPAWLYRRTTFQPLFDAGVVGHLKATLIRAPQMGVVVSAHFLALLTFGVHVPLGAGLLFIPMMLLVASLPITPHGLGTAQVLVIQFFARYAPGDEATQNATVVAYSLTVTAGALLLMAAMGLIFFRQIIRVLREPLIED